MTPKDLLNKTCIVTGANSGMGKIIATNLAKRGATLIMVCRIRDRAHVALNDVKMQSKNPNIDFMTTDLSSQEDIRELAKKINEKYPKIDILINNAGCMSFGYNETKDGIETTLATNHLAYFLLTNLLLKNLKKSNDARIINIASDASKSGKINLNDLNLKQNYSTFKAYSQSKLANILFTYELARKLKNYKNITVNAINPGNVPNTKLGQGSNIYTNYIKTLPKSEILTPEEGTETTIWLATSNEQKNTTGKYFYKKQQIKSSPISYDLELAKKLWNISAGLTNLG
ncbi:short-chain dehydrogenase [Candidatus Pacearchaeota archaeon]|jgi:NAD(P)-dependent dehydrogenase (short-subunit alcohol dehydrogenase family)|nr:short-chain dehydrogenase [Candidatus Pacearchaeota archaeon]|tara:strand:- start:111 stop:971 length:861 start_codon:yes stop_codon:yes gene_type:complete